LAAAIPNTNQCCIPPTTQTGLGVDSISGEYWGSPPVLDEVPFRVQLSTNKTPTPSRPPRRYPRSKTIIREPAKQDCTPAASIVLLIGSRFLIRYSPIAFAMVIFACRLLPRVPECSGQIQLRQSNRQRPASIVSSAENEADRTVLTEQEEVNEVAVESLENVCAPPRQTTWPGAEKTCQLASKAASPANSQLADALNYPLRPLNRSVAPTIPSPMPSPTPQRNGCCLAFWPRIPALFPPG